MFLFSEKLIFRDQFQINDLGFNSMCIKNSKFCLIGCLFLVNGISIPEKKKSKNRIELFLNMLLKFQIFLKRHDVLLMILVSVTINLYLTWPNVYFK